VTDQNYLAGFLLFLETVAPADQIRPSLVAHYSADLFCQWFRENRPDAVIGSREEIVEWARAIGFRCPDDFGFVHLDRAPGLTQFAGIDHNSELVGRGVIDLIIAQVQRGETGVPLHPTTTMVEGFWVNGPSIRTMPAAVEVEVTN
jgi:LacI family transcriptional regulator